MTEKREQLPLFEGFLPETSEIRLTGSTPGHHETFKIGQTVYFLVRGKVAGVNHERKGKDKVLVRSHKFEVLGAERVDAKERVTDALVAEAYEYLAAIAYDDDSPQGDVA